jgi:hypothetical protein
VESQVCHESITHVDKNLGEKRKSLAPMEAAADADSSADERFISHGDIKFFLVQVVETLSLTPVY